MPKMKCNPCRPPEQCSMCKAELTDEDLIIGDDLVGSADVSGGLYQIETIEGYHCPSCGFIERI